MRKRQQATREPDYGSGILAALLAETAFLVMVTAVAVLQHKDPWMPLRMAGALLAGPDAVAPAGFVADDVLLGSIMHAGMAVIVGALYALLLPRLSLSPVAGGIITGMVLFIFGFLLLPMLFPRWLAPFRLPAFGIIMQAVAHLLYGVVFGWVFQLRMRRVTTI